jgi:hypothetical protein
MKLKNLPSGQYQKIGTNYIALIDGSGTTCDNCGRLIANMVTVKHDAGKSYIIGQDCAKTLFDDKTNKEIDQAIKSEKRRKEQEPILREKAKRNAAFTILMERSRVAGINNTNINENWSKLIFNQLLDAVELETGITGIAYKR